MPEPSSPDECVTFSGTYEEYLEYCHRTIEYADGRYANNISPFRLDCEEQDESPCNLTEEKWIEIENDFNRSQ